ncbi:MAG: RsmE family RNA methyltransferase [Myxococcota bacterium]
MTLRRFFVERIPEGGSLLELPAAQSAHARVLRLPQGSEVELFDPVGHTARAIIEGLGTPTLCRVLSTSSAPNHARALNLILTLPKGAKVDDIVRSATELGVASIHFAVGVRSVSRPEDRRAAQKMERLIRIAREASRQSESNQVPDLIGPAPLLEVATRVGPEDTCWAFVARTAKTPAIEPIHSNIVWVAVGPEGGFCASEVAKLCEMGFQTQSLGDTVLRVETAATAGLVLALDRMRSKPA